MALVQSRKYGRVALKQTWAADPEVCQHVWPDRTVDDIAATEFVCSECGASVAYW